MKQLLAISWEMPPLSGPRAVQVTRTLSALGARGWQSDVVCFDAKSDRYQQDFHVPSSQLAAGAITLRPVPSPEEWCLVRALWRVAPPIKHLPDEKRVWVPSAIAEGRRVLAERRAGVIVSFAQPWSDHLVGLALHRESGLPWVAHFSDPWIDSPYQPGTAWTRRRAAAMEAKVVASATRLVFVNSQTRDRVMAKYPAASRQKVDVVPQGHEGPRKPQPQRASGPLRLVYTGRFYDGIRTPEVFLRAVAGAHRIALLEGRLEVEFVGSRMERYEELARQLGVGSIVRFAGRVSPDQARERSANADALLVIDAPSDGPSLFLPSKLIDYLPLGKPIVAIAPADGATADLVRELGYAVIDPRDQTGIATALIALVEQHDTGTLTSSPHHAGVASRYDIHQTTAAFEAVLLAAMGGA